VDCNTARMLLTFFGRQGSELAAEDATDLNAHLVGCPDCAAAVRFERAFDDRVGQAMLAVPIPTNLKAKLIDGVAAARGSWYRQKFYAVAGLAAAVVLTIGGVIAWQIDRAPALDITQIVREEDSRVQDPAAEIDKILSPRGLKFDPERPFNLNQLAKAGVGKFQGKDVPFLFFVNGPKNAQATVYVVRDTDFNWKALPQDGSSTTSQYGFQMAVVRDRNRSDVAYVVVFTGAGLGLFLEERSAA
jgi:hypothetical protein